jgi:ribose-phosphate pyrophosphokinase
MKIVACNSNRPLAEAVAATLTLPVTRASIRRFADMEVFVKIHENVRGEDVFVIQPTSYPANDTLMELLVTLDALRRSSARRITAVMPYFGYARQDRKTASRSPISAKLVANLITEAGANRVLTMDLHAAQIQGFFDIPVDNLYAAPLFSRDIQERYNGRDLMIGRPTWAACAGHRHAAELRSPSSTSAASMPGSEVMNVIGDVERRLHPGGRHGRFGARTATRPRHYCDRERGTGRRDMVCCQAARRGSHLVVVTISDCFDHAESAPDVRQLTIAPLMAEASAHQ